MKWLLDTNVICEPGKRRPDPKVVQWLDSLTAMECALSVITMGEIEKGIHAMPPGPMRHQRQAALGTLRHRFAGRILPVDDRVAAKWGELMGDAERHGRILPAIDNLIAAIAVVHGLTLVTRDTGDIAPGVRVLNPFE